jgi:transglutaminase-like putative cysteine protease
MWPSCPTPPVTSAHFDYFGNTLTSFTLQEPHDCLIVEANSDLEVNAIEPPDFSGSPPWETVRESLAGDHSDEVLNAYQFVFDSRRVRSNPALAAYARESFPEGRPLLAAVLDLTRRIHQDFRFDKKATEVATPVQTFFEKRRGVCQDFAHLQIGCMRSLGLPARYVSGYLRTMPPPGRRVW